MDDWARVRAGMKVKKKKIKRKRCIFFILIYNIKLGFLRDFYFVQGVGRPYITTTGEKKRAGLFFWTAVVVYLQL